MVRVRATEPTGNGEVLVSPPAQEWPALLESDRAQRASWSFEVGGVRAPAFADAAREAAVAAARAFSARLGVETADAWVPGDPIAMTGHQPELYHPGVWIKDFLVERFTRETGALGIDLVVDTDVFDLLAIEAPCMSPAVSRCRQYLAVGGPNTCYCSPNTLTHDDVARFADIALQLLDTLPAPRSPGTSGRSPRVCKARPATRAPSPSS